VANPYTNKRITDEDAKPDFEFTWYGGDDDDDE
jgi:hypothetical protein